MGEGNFPHKAMYQSKIKAAIARAPRTLGGELGRRAVRIDFSVVRIAIAVGATRQTVYHWMKGYFDVSPAYTQRVRDLISIMGQSQNAEQAWTKTCKRFNLKA